MKLVTRDGVAVQDTDGRIIIDGEKEKVIIESAMPAFAVATLKNFVFEIKEKAQPDPVDLSPAEREYRAAKSDSQAKDATSQPAAGGIKPFTKPESKPGAGVVSEPEKSESKGDAGVVSEPEKSQNVDGSGVS